MNFIQTNPYRTPGASAPADPLDGWSSKSKKARLFASLFHGTFRGTFHGSLQAFWMFYHFGC